VLDVFVLVAVTEVEVFRDDAATEAAEDCGALDEVDGGRNAG